MTTVNTLPSVRNTIPSQLGKEDQEDTEICYVNDVSIGNIWHAIGQVPKNQ